MKIKALVTMLVLGPSSAAMAAPAAKLAPAYRHQVPTPAPAPAFQPDLRDHRTPPARFAAWTLAGTAKLFRGKTTIAINPRLRVEKLKLEANRGTMFVDKLVVTFGNGATRTIEVDKWISLRAPALIDLDGRFDGPGRKVASVVVYGKGNQRTASFKLSTSS